MLDGNIDVLELEGQITEYVSLEGELLPIGPKGDKGDDGISPIISVIKTGKRTTITINDAEGTKYAYIDDGIDATAGGDMLRSVYDKNNNGIVDNAEKVNGKTVEANVPANAKFTDTLYDDTEVRNLINAKPDFSDMPTNVSELENDANYVSSDGDSTISGENTALTMSGTTKGLFKAFDLKGNTSQNGTPTPDSPIPINNVSGNNEIEVYNNLFSSSIVQGNVGATGVDTNTDRIRTEEHIKVKSNTKYKISFDSSIGINRYNVSFYNGINYTRLSETGWLTDTYFTTPSNCNYILVAFSKNGSGAIVPSNISNIMMNFGENSLPYTPYEKPQSYSINLGAIELNKIGTY